MAKIKEKNKHLSFNLMIFAGLFLIGMGLAGYGIAAIYRIYSAIRWGFHLSRMTTNKSVLCNFAIIQVLPFQNNLKDLDPSYKTDLDLWDCFGRKKVHLISEEIW